MKRVEDRKGAGARAATPVLKQLVQVEGGGILCCCRTRNKRTKEMIIMFKRKQEKLWVPSLSQALHTPSEELTGPRTVSLLAQKQPLNCRRR